MDEWKVLGEGRIGGGRVGERGPIVIVECWVSFLWKTPRVKDIVAKSLQMRVRVRVGERGNGGRFALLKEHLSRGLRGKLLLTCVAAFYFEL